MKNIPVFRGRAVSIVLSLVCCLAALPSAAAAHVRQPYTMEILVDGAPLEVHAARRTRYVEASPGREYAIRLRNNTSSRVAIALSVDGLNTIDARTTSAEAASKWILGPHQEIVLDGWQTGPSTARRFFFTTEAESYGAWLGNTARLGGIAAVVFRERRPDPVVLFKDEREGGRSSRPGPRSRHDAPSGESAGSPSSPAALSDELAATGIGREVDHRVRRVAFEAEGAPAAHLEIRYEYRDALVRLGVLPERPSPCEDPLARRERARGFDGMDFAPDPWAPPCP